MKHYRDIWREAYGEIPKDENGWSYEIHHIDGNRANNLLSNLRLVTIHEHYNIHFSQGDLNEANAILTRIKLLQKGETTDTTVLRGSTWYNNGTFQKQLRPEDPLVLQEGWVRGMLPSTVANIRKFSHKSTRPKNRPDLVKLKISNTLKQKYKTGERISNLGKKYNK